MYWRLHPTLNACIASNRIILLDIERDRYSAVPTEVTRPVIDWMRAGDGGPAPDAFLSLLARLGEHRPPQNGHAEHVQIPSEARPHLPRRRVSLASILSVFAVVAAMWIALRTRKLRTILEERAKARRVGSKVDSSTLRDQARTFADARRWCPIQPNCLLDSLAFDRWLGGPSDIQLVFGVLGQPFEAHCWVQSDDDVLNDSYDRVSRFEPILSI